MSNLILLDHASAEPLYMQLYRHFREEIEQQNLKEGEKMPSIPCPSEETKHRSLLPQA